MGKSFEQVQRRLNGQLLWTFLELKTLAVELLGEEQAAEVLADNITVGDIVHGALIQFSKEGKARLIMGNAHGDDLSNYCGHPYKEVVAALNALPVVHQDLKIVFIEATRGASAYHSVVFTEPFSEKLLKKLDDAEAAHQATLGAAQPPPPPSKKRKGAPAPYLSLVQPT